MTLSRVSGFYNWSLQNRLAWMARQIDLTEEDVAALTGKAGLGLEQADQMIENVIGYHSLPLGIALFSDHDFIAQGLETLPQGLW